jgi:anti-sigma-K factor RskA
MSTHDEWEELAAGHALGALEPDDEQRFEAHLATCDDCRQVTADTEAVMADMAYASEQMAPPPELKLRLMASIHDASEGPAMGVVSTPDTLEVIRNRRATVGRHTREKLTVNWVRLAAAASVVLLAIIAGGVWSLQGTSNANPAFVALQSPTGSTDVATVEVLGDKAWLINSTMPTNDSRSSQYVLWTVPAEGAPTAVGGFDVEPGHAVVAVGRITATRGHVAAFAVSKEPGRTVPAAPTVVVAKGSVKWPVVDAYRTYS